MSAQHTPGPWEVIPSGSWRRTFWVGRSNPAASSLLELLRSPAGRPTVFRSEAAARAAIAKATGAAS